MNKDAAYDIAYLLTKHQACLDSIAEHFAQFFKAVDYSKKNPKVKAHVVKSRADLSKILRGAGFYIIATDVTTDLNLCSLKLADGLSVVYRGHSSNVRERIESHLFYDSYREMDSGRRFTVCMKLDGRNINIDKRPLDRRQWLVVTHSMPTSTTLIRVAAESAFDKTFGRPIGSDK